MISSSPRSLDALKPGGILALVTSHFTLDKQNAATREYLAEQADFLGAIRLPSDAFKREGTAVVTDIVFLRKRAAGEPAQPRRSGLAGHRAARHRRRRRADQPLFPEPPGNGAGRLEPQGHALRRRASASSATATWPSSSRPPSSGCPSVPGRSSRSRTGRIAAAPAFTPPPPERHIAEGSFFVGDDKVIHQVEGGQGVPVAYGGTALKADGTMTGKRLAALIGLRDLARRVLQSQNEGWPEAHRNDARRELNRAYDLFVAAYGPINKTTLQPKPPTARVIRRMPNLVKFREDPDAMLVMALEDYDEVTGKAAKAPILLRDVVGKSPPITTVTSAEEGLLVSLDRTGGIDLPYIASSTASPRRPIIAELGDLIYRDPESKHWQTADEYLSGNVRDKLAAAEAAGPDMPATPRPCVQCSPKTCCPATSTPVSVPRGYRPPTSRRSPPSCSASPRPPSPIGHLKKDAVWSVDAGHAAEASVAATAEYGTPRANGTWLLELALNMKTPVIYDTIQGVNGEERVVNQEETLAAREKQKLIKEKFKSWVFAEPERTERLVRLV